MNDTSKYDVAANACNGFTCTFATTYPWMEQTAHASFDGYTNKQILVDLGGVWNTGGDNAG